MTKVIILGCGPSSGVPLVGYEGGYWGICDPNQPKNRRSRSSIYVEHQGISLLIDTSPDLRAQLLSNDIRHLDAVLITHDHADHTHGIDDLRPLYFCRGKKPFPLYSDGTTLRNLKSRFPYLMGEGPHSDLYPKLIDCHEIDGDFLIQGIPIQAFSQHHGTGQSWGFRFGKIAYSTDFSHLDEGVYDHLKDLDVWIVDCLSVDPKPTHLHLEKTLSLIERVKPRQAILTHMNHTLDYDTLRRHLPPSVLPAYDGMMVEIV